MSVAGVLRVLAPLSSGAILVYLVMRASSCDDPSREALQKLAERDVVRLQADAQRALQPPPAPASRAARMTEADFIDREIYAGFLGGTKSAPPGNAYKEFVAREHERQKALHAQSGSKQEFRYSSDVAFKQFNEERIARQRREGALIVTPMKLPPDELDRVLGTQYLYGTKAPMSSVLPVQAQAKSSSGKK